MDTIKKLIYTKKAVEYYGFKINKSGFIKCPFHFEKSPSLKIYDNDRGFSCFGCDAKGSVIDFVMKLFQINYAQAVVRLSHDFNLNLTNKKPDKREIMKWQKQKLEEAKQRQTKELITEFIEIEFKKNYINYHYTKPKQKGDDITDEFAESLVQMRQCEILMQESDLWK